MAETIKKENENASKKTKKRVFVTLPLNKGQNAEQQEFFSANFKNYLVKRGEETEVPEVLDNVIKKGEKAELYAVRYSNELTSKEAEKRKQYN